MTRVVMSPTRLPPFTGDVTSPGGSNELTLATVDTVTPGTYNSITVDEKGRVVAAEIVASSATLGPALTGLSNALVASGGTVGLLTQTGTDSYAIRNLISGSGVTVSGNLATGNLTLAITVPSISGDVTGSISGASGTITINTNAITNNKLAVMANNTIKANISGSSASPSDITPAQLTGVMSSFTTSAQGVVPASGSGANVLMGGGWASFASQVNTDAASNSYNGSNGSETLPSGLILKWGTQFIGDPNTVNTTSISFASPFPSGCYSVQVTNQDDNNTSTSVSSIRNVSSSGFTVQTGEYSGVTQSVTLHWFAVGK